MKIDRLHVIRFVQFPLQSSVRGTKLSLIIVQLQLRRHRKGRETIINLYFISLTFKPFLSKGIRQALLTFLMTKINEFNLCKFFNLLVLQTLKPAAN